MASSWMAWEGGVDLCAVTAPGLEAPNLIVHVARIVHTPVGSAPCGMILYQPNPAEAPIAMGFISTDQELAGFFGPHIFRDTPFETAPALRATISVTADLPRSVHSRVEVAGHVFEVTLSGLAASAAVDRAAGSPLPFRQHGIEAAATEAAMVVDGQPLTVHLPPEGLSGGGAAVWAPVGVYTR